MYFIKITSSYDPKNSLQKYLFAQLSRLECLTIENPDELKQLLDRLVNRANICYKRCSPTSAYMRPTHDKAGFVATISGIMQLNVYQHQGEFNSADLLRAQADRNEAKQTDLFTEVAA